MVRPRARHGGRPARAAGRTVPDAALARRRARAAGRRSSSRTTTARWPSASPTNSPISRGRCAHAFLEREALGVDEAVRMADAEPKGVVVLSDTGDTVFGGSAGDSNLLLEAMLRLKIRGPALIPMIAPRRRRAAVRGRAKARRVTLPVGGETATALLPAARGHRHGPAARRGPVSRSRATSTARSTWAARRCSRSAP